GAQRVGEGLDRQRLGQPWDALQQHVTAGQEADEDPFDHVPLADDDLPDLVDDPVDEGALGLHQVVHGLDVERCSWHWHRALARPLRAYNLPRRRSIPGLLTPRGPRSKTLPSMTKDKDAKEIQDARLFDARVVERNIKRGVITRKDYEKYLKSLGDAKEKAKTGE